MQTLYGLKVKIRPRYFGNENINTLEKLIKQVLDNEGLAIVVFDTDVSTWNESEKKKLSALRKKYSKNKRVILCDSLPSIEFWFLIHLKLSEAYARAKQLGIEGESYSNLWKAFDYLGVCFTKEKLG